MSDIQVAISSLSTNQIAVMSAENFEDAAKAANHQSLSALARKGLIEITMDGATDTTNVALTELGTGLRNALLAGGDDQKLCTPEEALAALADLEQFAGGVTTKLLVATGLDDEDFVEDEVLLDAYDDDDSSTGAPILVPSFGEPLVFKAAVNAAFSSLQHVHGDDSEGVAYIDAFNEANILSLFEAQYKAPAAFPTETLFRFVVPNAGDHWADCPHWLKVWLDVFAAIVVGLKPHVLAAREDLEHRVKEARDAKLNRRNRAKSDAKRQAKLQDKKDRLRKMKARREAAEKANATA
jgi:hypothetical protein